MKTTCLLLLAFAFSLTVPATAQGPTLSQLQETFQKQSKRIADELKVKQLADGERYLAKLATIQTGYQVAGLFDPMQAVKKERERWTKEFKLEAADVVDAPAELKALQKQFLDALAAQEVESSRKFLSLAGQYNKLLLLQRESLTKAGNLNQAGIANKEIKSLTTNPDLLKAKDQVAKANSDAAATAAATKPAAAASTSRSFREVDDVRLQKRYREFWDALANQQKDKVLTYVDPEHVKAVGENAIKPHIAVMQGIVGVAKGLGVTLSKTQVKLDPTKTQATMTPVLKNPFTGESNGDPSYWRLVEGDWYLDVTKEAKAAPQAPAQNPARFNPRNLTPEQLEEFRRRMQLGK